MSVDLAFQERAYRILFLLLSRRTCLLLPPCCFLPVVALHWYDLHVSKSHHPTTRASSSSSFLWATTIYYYTTAVLPLSHPSLLSLAFPIWPPPLEGCMCSVKKRNVLWLTEELCELSLINISWYIYENVEKFYWKTWKPEKWLYCRHFPSFKRSSKCLVESMWREINIGWMAGW